jgi:CRP/FNR family cyclic AMP-dependent transcriptional regulator
LIFEAVFEEANMRWLDLLGFSASLAVLAGFCMTNVSSLRMFSVASNVLFVTYGLLAHIYPVLLLHVILLPINVLKLSRAARAAVKTGVAAMTSASHPGEAAQD